MDVSQLSEVLLHMYEASRSESVQEFQQKAIQLLGQAIVFDNAWWGRATVSESQNRVHYAYRHNLPDDVADRLNLTDPSNLVAQRTRMHPGRVHAFGPDDWRTQSSTAALAAHMGVEYAICIALVDPSTGLANFFSLGRKPGRSQFSAEDQNILQWLTPNLTAALDICCVFEMARIRHGKGAGTMMVDSDGWLRVAEPSSGTLLRSEWSDWYGPRLPDTLVRCLRMRNPTFVGQRIAADIKWTGEHILLEIRGIDAQDMLSPKEKAVAQAYAAGHTFRQVAADMHLAPATVRHHLRSIYVKLGVNDKAELANCLRTSFK